MVFDFILYLPQQVAYLPHWDQRLFLWSTHLARSATPQAECKLYMRVVKKCSALSLEEGNDAVTVGNHIIWDRTALSHDPERSAHPAPPFSVLMREAVFTHPAAKDPGKQQLW